MIDPKFKPDPSTKEIPDSELEPAFYVDQILMMEERYEKIFKEWGVKWDKYYEKVKEKLRNQPYLIWVYLCGFEKFIQEEGWIRKKRKDRLKKDARERIKRVIGVSLKNEEYIKSL